ncbi:MAG: hypothetical protein ACOY45_08430 [Pseudomonadota bacterium]
MDRSNSRAGDLLNSALSSYRALCSLVVSIDGNDMHQVNPNDFWFLLEMVRERLEQAQEQIG